MVSDMMQQLAAWSAVSFLAVFLCSCDRVQPSEDKHLDLSKARERQDKVPMDKSGQWYTRLKTAMDMADREKRHEQNYLKALNDVAALYAEGLQNGLVHKLDVRSWCDSVAETGSGYSGETVIGAMFLYGTGIKRDAAMAKEWFEYGVERAGSQRGNALYMLGLMYFKGDGTEQSNNKALELWYKAVDEKHPASMGLLGRAYMEGKLGLDKDVESGLALLQRAANSGNVPSSVYLGKIYAKGEGVEQNMKMSMKWYEQAASGGDAHSQYIVGLAYLEGAGVDLNESKAFNWFQLAAGQDHVNAMLMLSVCYSTGKGTIQNADLAEVWKQKAVKLNAEREKKDISLPTER